MPDQNTFTPRATECRYLHVYLGHQRAGGVKYSQAAVRSLLLYGLGYPVGTENNDRVVGDFVELFDENRAAITQVIHYKFIVDHLVANINWFAEYLERTVNNIDRTINTGTKTAGIGEYYVHELHAPLIGMRTSSVYWVVLV
jgi:hypothetical protein